MFSDSQLSPHLCPLEPSDGRDFFPLNFTRANGVNTVLGAIKRQGIGIRCKALLRRNRKKPSTQKCSPARID